MILDPLERSYAEAETLTATWAKSFHFASRFLPAAKRRAVCALYAYCRERSIEHRACGKLVVATSLEQEPKLRALLAQAEANGVEGMR
ncbi:MAG TPA: squalene/phytoene synthase family protein, partial [Gemmatimonadales bacterium]|nr:squalene/phytoene synthase family protein [Gemmatimonadales bacterium]